jgi:hypothetical protein
MIVLLLGGLSTSGIGAFLGIRRIVRNARSIAASAFARRTFPEAASRKAGAAREAREPS